MQSSDLGPAMREAQELSLCRGLADAFIEGIKGIC